MTTSQWVRGCTVASLITFVGCGSDSGEVSTFGDVGTDGDDDDADDEADDDDADADADADAGESAGDADAGDSSGAGDDADEGTDATDDGGTEDGADGETTGDDDGTTTDPSGGESSSDGANDDANDDANNDTGEPEDCFANDDLVPCDANTNDPFQAMGLNCPQGIPISNETFSSADPDAWKIAAQMGTYIDPNDNEPLWSPSEGENMLVISTGHLNNPNGQGVITAVDGDMYDANNNPDAAALPAPISADHGSNGGNGGTPFVDCDGVNDCSDTLLDQWEFGDSEANDLLWFQFDVQVPDQVEGFTFDFAYFSVEFPEYVDTVYNDIFVVWSASETYTGNLCFVNDQPCTVTALWPIAYDVAAPELAGTGFDGGGFFFGDGGGTGWYVAQGSAAPNETLQLTYAVFDMGDTAYDTVVLLDNWRWDCEGCIPSEVNGCGIDPM